MFIGIDGSRAFLPERTGIEEYSYQVIRHLRDSLREEFVFLYIRSGQKIDFELPKNWQVKRLRMPRLWTQLRLSWELLLHPVDVLFVPAHTVPLIHPARNATLIGNIVALIIQKIIHPFTACMEEHSVVGGPRKTVVTIHGLEYEFCPEAYSLLDRWYMRLSIRFSCRAASTVIAVSENTKRDLERLYRLSSNKIVVIPEGYEQDSKFNLKIKKYKISAIPFVYRESGGAEKCETHRRGFRDIEGEIPDTASSGARWEAGVWVRKYPIPNIQYQISRFRH
jgi:glycosyltransferase involved in cell wall biosynthesis